MIAYNSYGNSTASATSSAATTSNDESNDNVDSGGSSGGGVTYGCKDESALNYEPQVRHKQSRCRYEDERDSDTNVVEEAIESLVLEYKPVLMEAYEAGLSLPQYILDIIGVNTDTPIRDLELGMEGDDVRKLQQLLNSNGYVLTETGIGAPGNETIYFGSLTQTALAAYQVANDISPANGYFGSFTREQMKTAGLGGLWW